MHGVCMETADGVTCDCEPAFEGLSCERCAPGFFDDGAGGLLERSVRGPALRGPPSGA
jgi:hypothetical protein